MPAGKPERQCACARFGAAHAPRRGRPETPPWVFPRPGRARRFRTAAGGVPGWIPPAVAAVSSLRFLSVWSLSPSGLIAGPRELEGRV